MIHCNSLVKAVVRSKAVIILLLMYCLLLLPLFVEFICFILYTCFVIQCFVSVYFILMGKRRLIACFYCLSDVL